MRKAIFAVVVLLVFVGGVVQIAKSSSISITHPFLTIKAMRTMPIGSKVLPFGDRNDVENWNKDYGWRSGNPAIVTGYKIVDGADRQPLLIYVIQLAQPSRQTLEVHPHWVIRVGD